MRAPEIVECALRNYAKRAAGAQRNLRDGVQRAVTAGRDRPVRIRAFRTQLKAIRDWGRAAPADLSAIRQPTLIAGASAILVLPIEKMMD